jgi:hypothetical protein
MPFDCDQPSVRWSFRQESVVRQVEASAVVVAASASLVVWNAWLTQLVKRQHWPAAEAAATRPVKYPIARPAVVGRRLGGALLAIGIVVSGGLGHAQGMVFGSVFVNTARDGGVPARPHGAVLAVTSPVGTGLDVFWATSSSYRWLGIDFLQVAPASRHGKTFQPFGAVGPSVISRGRDHVAGLALRGGVIMFFTSHLGASVDYRYFRGRGLLGDVQPRIRTISTGVNLRF